MKENSKPLVSIYCATYNHAKYIEDALQGFIMQKTDFSYEVIVHDDASTDGTQEIIKKYQEAYPNIIKPIYQSENQYSKGNKIFKNFVFPKVQGKYIAFCEGDDYWLDSRKLQMQIDFLEENPEYIACVHNTYKYNCVTGKKTIFNKNKKMYDLKFEDILDNINNVLQLSSLVVRTSTEKELQSNPPLFYEISNGLDLALYFYLVLNGKIKYFPQVMSYYRMFAEGSWTSVHQDKETRIKHINNMIDILKELDHYSAKNYHEQIEQRIKRWKMSICYWKEQYDVILKKEYKEVLKKESMRFQIKVWLLWFKSKCLKKSKGFS